MRKIIHWAVLGTHNQIHSQNRPSVFPRLRMGQVNIIDANGGKQEKQPQTVGRGGVQEGEGWAGHFNKNSSAATLEISPPVRTTITTPLPLHLPLK